MPLPLTDLDVVTRQLREGLAEALPGLEAHLVMAPKPRTGWRPAHLPEGSRAAAALLLLYPHDGEVQMLLTVRASSLPQHSGQVSLPGGALEAGEDIETAALREAAEEVGLEAAKVEVLGRLSPLHIPVSGFVLNPVVAISRERPLTRPDAHEVARIVEVPLSHLADPRALRLRVRMHEGRAYEVPYFAVDGEQLWGATAMVVGELLWILGHPPRLSPGIGSAGL